MTDERGRLSAIPSPEPCECVQRHSNGLGLACACACHTAGPLTRAMVEKFAVDLWNRGLPDDHPQRRRHLA